MLMAWNSGCHLPCGRRPAIAVIRNENVFQDNVVASQCPAFPSLAKSSSISTPFGRPGDREMEHRRRLPPDRRKRRSSRAYWLPERRWRNGLRAVIRNPPSAFARGAAALQPVRPAAGQQDRAASPTLRSRPSAGACRCRHAARRPSRPGGCASKRRARSSRRPRPGCGSNGKSRQSMPPWPPPNSSGTSALKNPSRFSAA